MTRRFLLALFSLVPTVPLKRLRATTAPAVQPETLVFRKRVRLDDDVIVADALASTTPRWSFHHRSMLSIKKGSAYADLYESACHGRVKWKDAGLDIKDAFPYRTFADMNIAEKMACRAAAFRIHSPGPEWEPLHVDVVYGQPVVRRQLVSEWCEMNAPGKFEGMAGCQSPTGEVDLVWKRKGELQ